jgi:hypothetical protein
LCNWGAGLAIAVSCISRPANRSAAQRAG